MIEPRRGTVRLLACIVAFSVISLAMVDTDAKAADFTWSGGSSPYTSNWSNGSNWAGGVAPSGSVGVLSFPSSACSTAITCSTIDDIAGITAANVSLVAPVFMGGDWFISGSNPLTLTSGLTATVQDPSGTLGLIFIRAPLVLGGPNTWTIDAPLTVSGGVTGASQPLTVNVPQSGNLTLAGDNEVGAVTITGTSTVPGVNLITGKLNSTDGNQVSVSKTGLGLTGTTGPLQATRALISIGKGEVPTGSVTVNGALTVSTSSLITFSIVGGSATAGTDYAQLIATGPVSLTGADLIVGLGGATSCPSLTRGATYTLLTTRTSLTGEFRNAPDGSVHGLPASRACGAPRTYLVRINYHRTGSPQTVTATVVPASTLSGLGSPSRFSLGKLSLHAAAGKAVLTVRVPAPGTLFLTGPGIKTTRTHAAAIGPVRLAITPTKRAAQKFKRRALRTKISVTYTPAGGAPRTKTRTFTL